MKLRYWVAGIFLFLTVMCGHTIFKMQEMQTSQVDMADINDRFCEVEKQLIQIDNSVNVIAEQETAIESIEETQNCQIYFHSEDDYNKRVNEAIRKQNILIDYEVDGKIVAKVVFAGEGEKFTTIYQMLKRQIVLLGAGMMIIAGGLMLYLYLQYIRPFCKLQRFAEHIANGDLDFALEMPKRNYFGAFTESFDIMREELKRARQGEYEANVSKKELVASLSHDIKTPVATIKAICEILMLKLKEEATLEKIVIINQKAGMIDTLISDMFHATLEDLMALKITPREELSTIILPMFEEINHYQRIHYENALPECLIVADALRLNQVIDNVINNSYKYANTDIAVSFHDLENAIEIVIKDFGNAVDDEEILLVTEKYFRGANAEGKNGSGLGLYLSNLFMEKMQGSFSCANEGGFVVRLTVPKYNANV